MEIKHSKRTKSNEQNKILRMISREEQFERNGGGQFVSMNKIHKNKKKYDRKQQKKDLRNMDLRSFYIVSYIIILSYPSL